MKRPERKNINVELWYKLAQEHQLCVVHALRASEHPPTGEFFGSVLMVAATSLHHSGFTKKDIEELFIAIMATVDKDTVPARIAEALLSIDEDEETKH